MDEAQRLAREAVTAYEQWEQSWDHSSTTTKTDEAVERLLAAIDSIDQTKMPIVRSDEMANVSEALCEEVIKCREEVSRCVKAERALRELAPLDSVRALVWGCGAMYPMLSQRETEQTAQRFVAARGHMLPPMAGDEGEGLCSLLQNSCSGNEEGAAAADSAKALVAQIRARPGSRSLAMPMYHAALQIKDLLIEEIMQLDATQAKAEAKNIYEEVEECRPHVGAPPPDTKKLDRLHSLSKKQAREFKRANAEFEIAEDEDEDEDDDEYGRGSTGERLAKAKAHRDACRRQLRTISKQVDTEMLRLAQQGSVHYPEVLVSVPSVASFKRCEFLRTDGLGLKSYDNVARMAAGGHSAVFSAKLDKQEVVLKQYDLTAGTINAVIREVTKLHEMRHPNIVEVQAVFEEKKKGSTLMYLQMPRYACDLKQWIKGCPGMKPPQQQRRKILLGLLRAVDRVHQYRLTHNDIKLENILLTSTDARTCEAVLCDFELLREESGSAKTSGATTIIGGTQAYMAPERIMKKRPSHASDMYSVGVVMLLSFSPHVYAGRGDEQDQAR